MSRRHLRYQIFDTVSTIRHQNKVKSHRSPQRKTHLIFYQDGDYFMNINHVFFYFNLPLDLTAIWSQICSSNPSIWQCFPSFNFSILIASSSVGKSIKILLENRRINAGSKSHGQFEHAIKGLKLIRTVESFFKSYLNKLRIRNWAPIFNNYWKTQVCSYNNTA